MQVAGDLQRRHDQKVGSRGEGRSSSGNGLQEGLQPGG